MANEIRTARLNKAKKDIDKANSKNKSLQPKNLKPDYFKRILEISNDLQNAGREFSKTIVATPRNKMTPKQKRMEQQDKRLGLEKIKAHLNVAAKLFQVLSVHIKVLSAQIQASHCVQIHQVDPSPVLFKAGVTPPDDAHLFMAAKCYELHNKPLGPGLSHNVGSALTFDHAKVAHSTVYHMFGQRSVVANPQNNIVDLRLLSSASSTDLEVQYAVSRRAYHMYKGDQVFGQKPYAGPPHPSLSKNAMGVSVRFSNIDERLVHTIGQNSVPQEVAQPRQSWHYDGQRIIRADLRFGSLGLAMPTDGKQFLGRTATIRVEKAITLTKEERKDPCNDDTDLIVTGLCEPEELCSPIKSHSELELPGNGWAVMMKNVGDFITVKLVLKGVDGPNAVLCWEVIDSNLKEEGPPCPDILMDHHWLPSWPEERAFFLHGPTPWLNNDVNGNHVHENPEIPTVFFPHRGRHAASFLFRPQSLNGGLLIDVGLIYSHPNPLVSGQWVPDLDGRLKVSLWDRNGFGGHKKVLDGPGPVSGVPLGNFQTGHDPINPGTPSEVYSMLSSRDSCLASMVNYATHPWGLPQYAAANNENPDAFLYNFTNFWVMKINRDDIACKKAATFVHAVLFAYIPSEVLNALAVGNDQGDNNGGANQNVFNLISNSGLSLGDIVRHEILTFDGLEGRTVCCDDVGPSKPEETEDDPCE